MSCALLALNGTTNTAGNPTTPSVPGTTTAVLGLPLTAANAHRCLDARRLQSHVGRAARQLLDSMQLQTAHQTIKDFTLKFDGPLFDLPAAAVRVGGRRRVHRVHDARGGVARARHRAGEHELLDDLHRSRPRREVGIRRAAGADRSAKAIRSRACAELDVNVSGALRRLQRLRRHDQSEVRV